MRPACSLWACARVWAGQLDAATARAGQVRRPGVFGAPWKVPGTGGGGSPAGSAAELRLGRLLMLGAGEVQGKRGGAQQLWPQGLPPVPWNSNKEGRRQQALRHPPLPHGGPPRRHTPHSTPTAAWPPFAARGAEARGVRCLCGFTACTMAEARQGCNKAWPRGSSG